ncbi:MAG: DUF3253 domain-containing protein [Chromatiaceae bacterium]
MTEPKQDPTVAGDDQIPRRGIESMSLTLLRSRKVTPSLCPSEIARSLAQGTAAQSWQLPMQGEVARCLRRFGELEILQGWRLEAPLEVRGAVRIRPLRSIPVSRDASPPCSH